MSSPPPSSIEAEREYENLLQVVILPLFQLPAEPTEHDIKEARERIPQIIEKIKASSKYKQYLRAPYPSTPTALLNGSLDDYLDTKAAQQKAAKEAQQKAAQAAQQKAAQAAQQKAARAAKASAALKIQTKQRGIQAMNLTNIIRKEKSAAEYAAQQKAARQKAKQEANREALEAAIKEAERLKSQSSRLLYAPRRPNQEEVGKMVENTMASMAKHHNIAQKATAFSSSNGGKRKTKRRKRRKQRKKTKRRRPHRPKKSRKSRKSRKSHKSRKSRKRRTRPKKRRTRKRRK